MSTTTGVKLSIEIDYREKEWAETLIKYGVPDHVELREPCNLDIGDMTITVVGSSNKKMIIERKRFDDLASSIKDGRYDEQKMRCLSYIQQNPGSRLIYMLEGDLSYCRNSADTNMVLGSWISMELRDRLPVIRVLSMDEGVKWVIRLCERIKKKPDEFFKGVDGDVDVVAGTDNIKTIYLGSGGGGQSEVNLESDNSASNIKQVTQTEYLGTIKTKKKENITPETCGQLMLSVIPGMSTDTAKIILDTVGNGTLVGLINTLSVTGDVSEKKKMLATLQIKPGRKLGPAMADKLWEYLFCEKN
jgi:ERCC4-type nuclease